MRAAGKSSPCSSNSHHVPDTLLCPLWPHFFGLPASESSELCNICSWKRSLGAQNQNMTPRGFEHLRAICKGPRLKVDFLFKQSMYFGHQCLPGRRNWVSCGKSCRLPGHLKCGGPWWTMVDSGTLDLDMTGKQALTSLTGKLFDGRLERPQSFQIVASERSGSWDLQWDQGGWWEGYQIDPNSVNFEDEDQFNIT